MPAPRTPRARNEPARFRSSTIRSGSSGGSLLGWIITTAASSSTPVTRKPTVVEEPQPWVWAWARPYTSANRPPVAVSVPGTSIRGLTAFDLDCSSANAPSAAGTAKPRFTNIVQRHDSDWVSTPPSNRPSAPAPPPIAPQTANALPRSPGSVNVVVSSDNAAGASSAANTPCSARAAKSTSKLCAAPPIADATANPIAPPTNVRLRPNRSPSRPPSSNTLPKASAYAVMIHWRLSLEKCSAFCAEGSAMFTTVASSTTISCAIPRTARIHQRRRWSPSLPTTGAARSDVIVCAGMKTPWSFPPLEPVRAAREYETCILLDETYMYHPVSRVSRQKYL